MPYKHSAEIGDLWKHLPLCDVLRIENPKRYYETNAAFAEYELEVTNQKQYGVFHVYEQAGYELLHKSTYFEILDKIDLKNKHRYYGSPALAMTILCNRDVHFYFHDIEKEPLDDIKKFSEKLNIKNKVSIACGDSIETFLQDSYCFNHNDFIFLDPYMPFDSNKSGKTFFDIFIKAYRSHAKTVFWYGYDNLISKNTIIEKLQAISYEFTESINTFDVWQKSMSNNFCITNPGVPGCGIAVANLSEASIQKIREYLYIISDLYNHATYNDADASLCVGHLLL